MTKLTIACVLGLALVGCKKEAKPEAGKAEAPAASAAKEAPPAEPKAAPAEPQAAPAPAAPSGGGTVDGSDPAKVVEAIFEAAKSGKADALPGLCDPAGSGDGDVKSVCATKPEDPTWARFAKDFSTGKIDGAPTIEGDNAAVTFLFGRDGSRKETMNLKKIGGKWYLASF